MFVKHIILHIYHPCSCAKDIQQYIRSDWHIRPDIGSFYIIYNYTYIIFAYYQQIKYSVYIESRKDNGVYKINKEDIFKCKPRAVGVLFVYNSTVWYNIFNS